MSQLKIRTKGFNEVKLNVLSFMSPIFASSASSQTQSSMQHQPIRCQQPNIRFDVIFRSEKEYEDWQTFIRNIQLKLLRGKDPNDVAVVTLWWPERDIKNWQGLIKVADGGGSKFNWAPQTTVEVEITKGLVAQQAALFSFGTEFDAIFGGTRNTLPNADLLISTPAQTLIGNGIQQPLGLPGGGGGSTGLNNVGLNIGGAASGLPGGSVSSLFGAL